MSKHLLLTLIFTLATGLLFAQQVDKMVIVEEFTNASCAPCAAQNPAFNNLLDQNLDQVIPLKFQTAFPGFDPYNEQNPSEVASRLNLYPEITGVPTATIDGVVPDNNYGGGGLSTWIDAQGNGYNGGPYGYNQAVLDYAASVPTTLGIEVSAEISNFNEMGTVEVQITNVDSLTLTDDTRLFIVLVERENIWPEPPGSTNEADFYYIMRKMYPGVNGIDLDDIPGDSTITIETDVQIPDYIYNLGELSFVAFVQSQSDRSIYNAAITDRLPVPSIYPNMTFGDNASSVEGGLCDRVFMGEIEVTNEGSAPISQFDLILNNNGSAVATETVTDTLAVGASTSISFEPLELPGGLSNLSYSLDNVNGANGARLVNALATVSETVSAQSVQQTDETEISYGFELDVLNTTAPDGAILQNPGSFMRVVSRNSFQNAPSPVGGYGNSEQSLWVNFYQWNPATAPPARGEVILAREFEIDPDASELIISFDRAHAQYTNPVSNDGLEGYISYDCGENWTRVYSKSGTSLSTTAPIEPFFIPTPTQWATDSITIELDGTETTGLFKFDAISAWGNNLYLDNIKAEGAEIVSSVNPGILQSEPTVYPNPSAGQSTLEFEVTKRQRMNISLYNAMGQVTHTIADREFPAGQYRMPLTLGQSSTGMYRILFTTEDGVESIPFVLTR